MLWSHFPPNHPAFSPRKSHTEEKRRGWGRKKQTPSNEAMPRKGTSWVLLRFPGGPLSPQSTRRASTPALDSQLGYLPPPPLRVSVSPDAIWGHTFPQDCREEEARNARPPPQALGPAARRHTDGSKGKNHSRGPTDLVRVPPVPLA